MLATLFYKNDFKSLLFNSFYAEHSVSNAETPEKLNLRIKLSLMTSLVIKSGLQLLGIGVPERM